MNPPPASGSAGGRRPPHEATSGPPRQPATAARARARVTWRLWQASWASAPAFCAPGHAWHQSMHCNAGAGAKRCEAPGNPARLHMTAVRCASRHWPLRFGLPRAAPAQAAQLDQRALLRRSRLVRDAAVRCHAVRDTCSKAVNNSIRATSRDFRRLCHLTLTR
jgi:hypothetical protein